MIWGCIVSIWHFFDAFWKSCHRVCDLLKLRVRVFSGDRDFLKTSDLISEINEKLVKTLKIDLNLGKIKIEIGGKTRQYAENKHYKKTFFNMKIEFSAEAMSLRRWMHMQSNNSHDNIKVGRWIYFGSKCFKNCSKVSWAIASLMVWKKVA